MNEVERLELEVQRLELEARLMAEEELEALIQAAPQLSEILLRTLAVIQNIAVTLEGLRLKGGGRGRWNR